MRSLNQPRFPPTSMSVPSRELKAKVGIEFSIELPSNRTTGHRWEANFDSAFMQLLTSTYARSSQKIGSGGTESFTFKPLKKGRTLLRMVYKRPWEKTNAKEVLYEAKIDDSSAED